MESPEAVDEAQVQTGPARPASSRVKEHRSMGHLDHEPRPQEKAAPQTAEEAPEASDQKEAEHVYGVYEPVEHAAENQSKSKKHTERAKASSPEVPYGVYKYVEVTAAEAEYQKQKQGKKYDAYEPVQQAEEKQQPLFGSLLKQQPAPPPLSAEKLRERYAATRFFPGRQWNEEYQRQQDRVAATPQQVQERAEAMDTINRDFQKQCTANVELWVAQQTLPPADWVIKPDTDVGGVAGGEKFIVDHIMFKSGITNKTLGIYGSPAECLKGAQAEIRGLNVATQQGFHQLHVPLCCMIKTAGMAITAQALVPVGANTLVYGTDNAAYEVHDGKEHPLILPVVQQLAQALHLKPHQVKEDKTSQVKTVCLAADVEVHLGRDGRIYLLDAARLLPPFGAGHVFSRFLRIESLKRLQQDHQPPLNADAFSGFNEATRAVHDFRDENAVDQGVKFVKQTLVSELVADLESQDTWPSLSQAFHEHGVNMHLLGLVYAATTQAPLRHALRQEMVIRVVKRGVHELWRLSGVSNEDALKELLVGSTRQLFHDPQMWASVCQAAQRCYGVDLSPHRDELLQPGLALRILVALGAELESPPESLLDPKQSVRVKLSPRVKAVQAPTFLSLKQLEERLRLDLELRQAAGADLVPILKLLLELYQAWKEEEPAQSYAKGVRVIEQLVELNDERAHLLGGNFHEYFGQLEPAREMLQQHLTAELKNKGAEHQDVAVAYNDLSTMLLDQGDLTGADEYQRRALAIRLKALGPDHPLVASDYNNLAQVLQDQGNLPGAAEYQRKALAISLKALGADHPTMAIRYNNLAQVLQAQGDLPGAAEYMRKAIAIDEKALGKDHPGLATDYNNLAQVMKAQGDLPGAAEYQRKALAISLKALGADHPTMAIRYNNLAQVLEAQGDLPGALEYNHKALAIRLKALGLNHPDVAQSYNNLAQVLQAQGDLAGAEEYQRKALAISLKALGADHPTMAIHYNNLAQVLKAQGDLPGALEYIKKALAIWIKALGADHTQVAIGYNNRALVLIAQNKHGEAEEYAQRAVQIFTAALGANHPHVAIASRTLAQTQKGTGNKVTEAKRE